MSVGLCVCVCATVFCFVFFRRLITSILTDFLGKSKEMMLVSELTVLAQKWSNIAAQKKVFLVSVTHYWWIQVTISSSIIHVIVGEGQWLWLLALVTSVGQISFFWPNEYPNIFGMIKISQMNIRINLPLEKSMNIFANEYIRPTYLNIFDYQIFLHSIF